jgi:HEAT repeat protein
VGEITRSFIKTASPEAASAQHPLSGAAGDVAHLLQLLGADFAAFSEKLTDHATLSLLPELLERAAEARRGVPPGAISDWPLVKSGALQAAVAFEGLLRRVVKGELTKARARKQAAELGKAIVRGNRRTLGRMVEASGLMNEVREAMVRAARDRHFPGPVSLVRKICELGERGLLPVLDTLIGHADAQVRREAFGSALVLDPHGARPRAIRMLDDPDEDNVKAACRVLTSIGLKWDRPEVMESCLPLLSTSMSPHVPLLLDVLLRLNESPLVRNRIFGVAARSKNPVARLAAAQRLEVENLKEPDLSVIRSLVRDDEWETRLRALNALANRGHMDWREHIEPILKSREVYPIRALAEFFIARYGNRDDLPLLKRIWRKEPGLPEVGVAACRTAIKLAPDRRAEFGLRMAIGSPDDKIREEGLTHMAAAYGNDLCRAYLAVLSERWRFETNPRVLILMPMAFAMTQILERYPAAVKQAVDLFAAKADSLSRLQVARKCVERESLVDVLLLRKLLEDAGGPGLEMAGRALIRIAEKYPDALPREILRKAALAVALFGRFDDDTRLNALRKLRASDDPSLLFALIRLARDESAHIRHAALGRLAGVDDPRALAEIFASLNDTDTTVRGLARRLLVGHRVAALRRAPAADGERPWDRAMRLTWEANAWAGAMAKEILGVDLDVQQYRQGVGVTSVPSEKRKVSILVSDLPVMSGHPDGVEVMKGIALHEIGHHLCDFRERGYRAVSNRARKEGLDEILNVLLDERLERRMRSMRPEWGALFDRVRSYVFVQETVVLGLEDYARLGGHLPHKARELVESGRAPGRIVFSRDKAQRPAVALTKIELMSLGGATPPFASFVFFLRSGVDRALCPDEAVRQALALIPDHLKDLRHAELLKLARAIGDLIGRSEAHLRAMKRWREFLRQQGDLLKALQEMLDRMAAAGQLPDWMEEGAPGIRRVQESSEQSEVARAIQTLMLRKIPRGKSKARKGTLLNLGPGTEFSQLGTVHVGKGETAGIHELPAPNRSAVRLLRRYLERLGARIVDEPASRRGRRVDIARARLAALRRTPDLLVRTFEDISPDLYIGVIVDKSASMAERDKIDTAKSFAALIAECAKGLRGIEGHISAFDERKFYRLGDFRRHAIATLEAGGGNNDAGALWAAAQHALASRKRRKLLIMISDGMPSHCTFESLASLVRRLTEEARIVCVQVAVDRIEHVAFPHFVDLSHYPLAEAVSRFGRMIMRLIEKEYGSARQG